MLLGWSASTKLLRSAKDCHMPRQHGHHSLAPTHALLCGRCESWSPCRPLASPSSEPRSRDAADQELAALEILELLDKLRVQKPNVRPLRAGSRPGQLTSARLLVAFDKVSVPEVLDAIRWAFSTPGSARGWPERLPKVYVLREQLPKLLEEYRRASVGDISGEVHQALLEPAERTPEENAELRRRLENHR